MKSTQEPLVSVVTPVYNGEQYLRECIESVLAQTYGNWDYTIVNNCSTDDTAAIAREYAARDPRIKVVDNEKFVRVIENYNIAFRNISPESRYCKVVAADDWLFPECLARMVAVAEAHPSVAIVGTYGLLGKDVAWTGLPYPGAVVSGRELCRASLLGGPYVFGNATSELFRSDILRSRHAFYNESNFHADTEACYEFLEYNDFGFVHQVLVYQRVREESLRSFSKRINTYLPATLYFLVRYGPKYLPASGLMPAIDDWLLKYYRFLGQQVYNHRDDEFWNFHKKKLGELGYPLDKLRLTTAAASYLAMHVIDPTRMAAGMLRRMRRLWSRLTGRVH